MVAGRSISQAEGQTVGKQLIDALQSGEGVVRQIEDGGVAVIDKIGSFFSGGDVENNVDKAREALSQGNNETGARLSKRLMRPSKIVADASQVWDNV